MNRTEFEALRDLLDKKIRQDIRLSPGRGHLHSFVAEDIPIENSENIDARITVTFNPDRDAKIINVHVPGLGPICRLCVDGAAHRPFGRSHKHSLQTERCPERNLPDGVVDMPTLSGQSLDEVFREFCRMANIVHEGALIVPPEATGGVP